MIKAVIFDLDNTLYSYDKAHAAAFDALCSYAFEKLGLSREDFERLLKKTQAKLTEDMGDVAAVHNRTIRFQNLLEEGGYPLHPHVLEMDSIYWDTLIRVSVPSDGALDALRALKARGIRTGIGTDMTARVQFRKLTALGMLPMIDFVVSSEEAGAEKPDPLFFARCAAKAGCAKEECLFVGDSLKKDALGAAKAGLQAVWYCPDGYSGEADVRRITNFAALPSLVSEL